VSAVKNSFCLLAHKGWCSDNEIIKMELQITEIKGCALSSEIRKKDD
jgi:hypothetical protein